MAYQKRRSTALEKAQARLRGLESLHLVMNLGNGLTLQAYSALIEESDSKLESHNLALAEADRTRIELAEAEAAIAAISSRLLSAVAALYGKDSKEYEMAGGKPPSSYRRSRSRSTVTGLSSAQSNSGTAPSAASNGASTNGTASAAQLS